MVARDAPAEPWRPSMFRGAYSATLRQVLFRDAAPGSYSRTVGL